MIDKATRERRLALARSLRLHRGRGRRPLSLRRGARRRCRPRAGARGSQGRRQGPRPLARCREAAADDQPHGRAAHGEAKATVLGSPARRATRPPLGPRGAPQAADCDERPEVAARRRRSGRPSASTRWPSAPRGWRADRKAASRRADHRSPRLARRPRCTPDPQGQARQAERVRLRLSALRAHPEHPPGARGLILPSASPIGSPNERSSCPKPPPSSRRRARPARGRPRRRLRAGPDQPDPDSDADDLDLRTPAATVRAHSQAPRPLPGRSGGPDQPPETKLRPPENAITRLRRRTDLGWLVGSRLQPRHARRPPRLRHSPGSSSSTPTV